MAKMDISVMKMVEVLKDYAPEYSILHEEYRWVSEVILVEGDINSINPNLLYLCEVEYFSEFENLNSSGNVLIVCPEETLFNTPANLNFNVIVLKSSERIETVYKIIHEIFEKNREFSNKKNKLIEGFLGCRNLQNIIDIGYEVLGNPMFVSDLGYHILGFNENVNVIDPSWPAKPEEEFESYERLKKLNDSGVFERLYRSDTPCIENFDYSPTRWMAHKISLNGKSIGHIAVVESEKIFDEMDSELLQFLCEIVAVELHKDSIKQRHYNSQIEQFFIDLLEEKITKYELIEKRAKDLKLEQKTNMVLVTLTSGNKTERVLSLSYMKNLIDRLFNAEKSVLYKNGISLLFDSEKIKVVTVEMENKLSDFLKSNEMKAGISQCFHDIAQFKKYFHQSVKAIEMGVSLKPEENCFRYDDYSIDHLLEIAASQADLIDFCNPLLFELKDFDHQYKTDYCRNLYIYLLCDGSLTEASKIFEIHRNTMKYRINKIEEILDISLDNIQTKYSLWMSFKILIHIGETQFFIS